MKGLLAKWKSLSKETKSGIYFGLGAIALFIVDIVTKWVVNNNLKVGDSIAVIPNFFYITLSYNTGAAFSLGSTWGVWGRILGIAISLIMSVCIIWYWAKSNKKVKNFERLCLMLLVAGAVGNLIDRAFYWEGTTGFNGVIDFLQFYLGGGPEKANSVVNPFATFNVADACLVVGVILMICYFVYDAIKNSKNDPNQKDPRLEAAEKKDDATETKAEIVEAEAKDVEAKPRQGEEKKEDAQ